MVDFWDKLLVFNNDLYKRSSYQNDYKITFYLNNGKVFGGYWKEVHPVKNVYNVNVYNIDLKVFVGYWKEVHRVENVYVNLALHSIREMAALTKLRIFNIKISTFHFLNF